MRLGDTIDITIQVRSSGTLTDATSFTTVVRDPKNVETSYAYPGESITRLSTGTYRLRMTIATDAEIGMWTARTRSNIDGVYGSGVTSFLVTDVWQ